VIRMHASDTNDIEVILQIIQLTSSSLDHHYSKKNKISKMPPKKEKKEQFKGDQGSPHHLHSVLQLTNTEIQKPQR